MGAYKDKGGRWYVSVRYKNWLGEPSRKTKRGFTTKRDALEWEREFLQKSAGSLDMTFNSFYEVYRNDLQNRIRQNTWVTKSSIIEKKILPYFGDKRVRDVKPVDVLHWQNIIMETKDENGMPYSPVYLKTIHNQLSAMFNHAVRFYGLPENSAAKAGNSIPDVDDHAQRTIKVSCELSEANTKEINEEILKINEYLRSKRQN